MPARLQAIPAPLRLVMLALLAVLAAAVTLVATRHGAAPHTGAFLYYGAAHARPNFLYYG